MAVRITWSTSGKADLRAIAEYISRDSARYAAGVVRRIIATAEDLASFPLQGRQVPEFDDSSLRECIVGSYRLVYCYLPDQVTILAVVHGARDLLTFSDEEHRAGGSLKGSDS